MTTMADLTDAILKRPGETWRLDPPAHFNRLRFKITIPVHCPRCFEYKDPDGNPNPRYASTNLQRGIRGKYAVWFGRCLLCGLYIYMMDIANLKGEHTHGKV